MSREIRERRLKAQENWPELRQFLECYLHEDWNHFDASPEAAIDRAIGDHALDVRQAIVRQWRDWNAVEASQHDPRLAINDGLRSEERRVGKECVSTCRSRWSPSH